MTRIKRAVVKSYGDESHIVIEYGDIADPADAEVQIKVEYSALSGADINMRKGIYPFQRKAPLTLGYSIVGKVHVNGGGSSRFSVGDRVAALTMYDGQAELANVAERFLVAVPKNVDPQQAVALVVDWMTAYQMNFRVARVETGQKVFIHGISGGVGRGLLPFAKHAGAKIYGTASEKNHLELRRLGATPYVYTDKSWIGAMKALGGVDVVFDALGFNSFDESYSILRPGGLLVGYGFNLPTLTHSPSRAFVPEMLRLLSKNLFFWTGKRTTFFGLDRKSKYYLPDLKALFVLAADGKLTVPIKAVFGLSEVGEAHRAWANSSGMGTIIINVQG